jgi:hypothetical protein
MHSASRTAAVNRDRKCVRSGKVGPPFLAASRLSSRLRLSVPFRFSVGLRSHPPPRSESHPHQSRDHLAPARSQLRRQRASERWMPRLQTIHSRAPTPCHPEPKRGDLFFIGATLRRRVRPASASLGRTILQHRSPQCHAIFDALRFTRRRTRPYFARCSSRAA